MASTTPAALFSTLLEEENAMRKPEDQVVEVTADMVLGTLVELGPMTIVDLWNEGFQRGKPLHEALRSLEAEGHISNRLEFANSPHRVYRAVG